MPTNITKSYWDSLSPEQQSQIEELSAGDIVLRDDSGNIVSQDAITPTATQPSGEFDISEWEATEATPPPGYIPPTPTPTPSVPTTYGPVNTIDQSKPVTGFVEATQLPTFTIQEGYSGAIKNPMSGEIIVTQSPQEQEYYSKLGFTSSAQSGEIKEAGLYIRDGEMAKSKIGVSPSVVIQNLKNSTDIQADAKNITQRYDAETATKILQGAGVIGAADYVASIKAQDILSNYKDPTQALINGVPEKTVGLVYDIDKLKNITLEDGTTVPLMEWYDSLDEESQNIVKEQGIEALNKYQEEQVLSQMTPEEQEIYKDEGIDAVNEYRQGKYLDAVSEETGISREELDKQVESQGIESVDRAYKDFYNEQKIKIEQKNADILAQNQKFNEAKNRIDSIEGVLSEVQTGITYDENGEPMPEMGQVYNIDKLAQAAPEDILTVFGQETLDKINQYQEQVINQAAPIIMQASGASLEDSKAAAQLIYDTAEAKEAGTGIKALNEHLQADIDAQVKRQEEINKQNEPYAVYEPAIGPYLDESDRPMVLTGYKVGELASDLLDEGKTGEQVIAELTDRGFGEVATSIVDNVIEAKETNDLNIKQVENKIEDLGARDSLSIERAIRAVNEDAILKAASVDTIVTQSGPVFIYRDENDDVISHTQALWNGLSDDEKALVAKIWVEDPYKKNYFADVTREMELAASEGGLIGQMFYMPVLGITSPIAKQSVGLKVTPIEWVGAAATAAIDVATLGTLSGLGGLTTSVLNDAALTGFGAVYVNKFNTMDTSEKLIYGALIAVPTAIRVGTVVNPIVKSAISGEESISQGITNRAEGLVNAIKNENATIETYIKSSNEVSPKVVDIVGEFNKNKINLVESQIEQVKVEKTISKINDLIDDINSKTKTGEIGEDALGSIRNDLDNLNLEFLAGDIESTSSIYRNLSNLLSDIKNSTSETLGRYKEYSDANKIKELEVSVDRLSKIKEDINANTSEIGNVVDNTYIKLLEALEESQDTLTAQLIKKEIEKQGLSISNDIRKSVDKFFKEEPVKSFEELESRLAEIDSEIDRLSRENIEIGPSERGLTELISEAMDIKRQIKENYPQESLGQVKVNYDKIINDIQNVNKNLTQANTIKKILEFVKDTRYTGERPNMQDINAVIKPVKEGAEYSIDKLFKAIDYTEPNAVFKQVHNNLSIIRSELQGLPREIDTILSATGEKLGATLDTINKYIDYTEPNAVFNRIVTKLDDTAMQLDYLKGSISGYGRLYLDELINDIRSIIDSTEPNTVFKKLYDKYGKIEEDFGNLVRYINEELSPQIGIYKERAIENLFSAIDYTEPNAVFNRLVQRYGNREANSIIATTANSIKESLINVQDNVFKAIDITEPNLAFEKLYARYGDKGIDLGKLLYDISNKANESVENIIKGIIKIIDTTEPNLVFERIYAKYGDKGIDIGKSLYDISEKTNQIVYDNIVGLKNDVFSVLDYTEPYEVFNKIEPTLSRLSDKLAKVSSEIGDTVLINSTDAAIAATKNSINKMINVIDATEPNAVFKSVYDKITEPRLDNLIDRLEWELNYLDMKKVKAQEQLLETMRDYLRPDIGIGGTRGVEKVEALKPLPGGSSGGKPSIVYEETGLGLLPTDVYGNPLYDPQAWSLGIRRPYIKPKPYPIRIIFTDKTDQEIKAVAMPSTEPSTIPLEPNVPGYQPGKDPFTLPIIWPSTEPDTTPKRPFKIKVVTLWINPPELGRVLEPIKMQLEVPVSTKTNYDIAPINITMIGLSEKSIAALQSQEAQPLLVNALSNAIDNSLSNASKNQFGTQSSTITRTEIVNQLLTNLQNAAKRATELSNKLANETSTRVQYETSLSLQPQIKTETEVEPTPSTKVITRVEEIKEETGGSKGTPSIILPSLESERVKREILNSRGAIGLYQGKLKQGTGEPKEFWYIIKYPYRSENDAFKHFGPLPEGVSPMVIDGAVYNRVQLLTGIPPERLTIDLGLQDIIITRGKGRQLNAKYIKDPQRRTRGDIDVRKIKTVRM